MKGDFTRRSFQQKQHYHGVLKQQGRVDLDSDWNEQNAITVHRVETEALDVIGPAGAPQDDAGFMIQAANNGASLSISAGRAYVDGILCENEQPNLLITAQPDLPGFQLPTALGTYIAYLEVWERNITFLDDSNILEVALGGPDTTTRSKTMCQVKLLQAGSANANGNTNVTCATDVSDYDNLIAPGTGTLQAQAQPTAMTDPCSIPANAGYRSLENQLYRVEIHQAGTGDATAGTGTATFKWSRDNGTVVASWIAPPSGQSPVPNTLFVSRTGKDSVLGFAAGQWVELSDDSRELNFQPGTLVQLSNVQGQVLTVNPATVIPSGASLSLADYPRNPKVRRWDSVGATPATTGAYLDLENGVQVQFAAGTYATGDYWMIPARTLTASIEWPVDGSGNPVAQPPLGIHRHYCRLAIVQFNGQTWSVIASCLPTFPPLTDLSEQGIHITGVQILDVNEQPQALLNDSNVSILNSRILEILVLLDAAADPLSAQPTTCFVTVEVPYPLKDAVAVVIAENLADGGNTLATNAPTDTALRSAITASNLKNLPLMGYQPLILTGSVAAESIATSNPAINRITWTATGFTLALLRELLVLLPALQSTSRLLARLTLKGNCIWALNDPTLYLDGEAFGVARQDPDGTHIGLRLPESGDGKRGGDFEMWFWLMLPVTLVTVTFSPNPVNVSPSAPGTATGTLTLVGTELVAGNSVSLTAQAMDPTGKPITGSIATVPASVTLGTVSSPTFQITNIKLPAGIPSATLQVTATYGTSTSQGTLTIGSQVGVSGISFKPVSIVGGAAATLIITLSAAAPAAGAVVTLSSNIGPVGAAPAATVPASATVPAGQTTVTVAVPTIQRANTFTLQVVATLNGTATAALNITAPLTPSARA